MYGFIITNQNKNLKYIFLSMTSTKLLNENVNDSTK